MPILVLLVIAACAGLLAAAGASRYPERPPGSSTAVTELAERVGDRRGWLAARRDPEAATGLALTLGLLVVGVAGVLIGLLAALVRSNEELHDLDSGVGRWADRYRSPRMTTWLDVITSFGDATVIVPVALIVVVLAYRRAPSRWIVPFLALVPLGDVLVTTAIKDLVDRARPTLNPIAATLGPSFPSGHSSTAASFYAACALLLARGRGRTARTALVGTAVGIAVAVASSRVLLDVHWLSDVIAGLALGWAWFSICAIAFGGRLLRFGAPAEAAAPPDVAGRPAASGGAERAPSPRGRPSG